MGEPIRKTFTRCPACKSKNRFLEGLAEQAKINGTVGDKYKLAFDMRKGMVMDNNKAILLKIGSKVPSYFIATDICEDCGCMYAVQLSTGEGRVQMEEGTLPKFPLAPQHLS
jgi:hypothetical protein